MLAKTADAQLVALNLALAEEKTPLKFLGECPRRANNPQQSWGFEGEPP